MRDKRRTFTDFVKEGLIEYLDVSVKEGLIEVPYPPPPCISASTQGFRGMDWIQI